MMRASRSCEPRDASTPLAAADEIRSFASGTFVPIPASEFRTVAIEDQIDAVLYLGPRTPDGSSHEVPRELCSEPDWLDEQVRRTALAAPRTEAERLKEHCAPVR
jgi:hypothetical protein